MKEFLKKNKVTIIILLIIAEGLFLRLFNLIDWLHFQLDQSRDAFLIKEVYEKGIENLPLLGPRAGGSFLRLGPAYYYLMYLLVLITRSTHPVIFVLPEILCSIAFVPMFYLLAKRLFNTNWSLILTALAVNSTFLITYDRFSWNPNLMPLFTVTTIYAWLKYLETKRKSDNKKSILWISLTALSVGLLIQLHFEAFVTVPIILVISMLVFCLWLWKNQKQEIKNKLLSLLRDLIIFIIIILATHTPVLLNEYISNGSNTKEFFSTVSEKQDKDELHSFSEQLIQNFTVYPKGFFNVITGSGGVYFPTVLIRPGLNLLCGFNCRDNYTTTIIATLMFLAVGGFFFFYIYRKTKNIFLLIKPQKITQKGVREYELLVLLFAWVVVPWWVFYSISFNLRPRFFLFVAVPFWVIAGFFLQNIYRLKRGGLIASAFLVILFTTNLANQYADFQNLASAELSDKENYPEDQIFYRNEGYPTTLRQQNEISRWIVEKYQQDNNKYYLFVLAPPYFYRSIMYIMDDTVGDEKLRYFTSNPSWQNADYFAVVHTTDPDDFFRKEIPEFFNVRDQKAFGTLTVYQLELTEKGLLEAKNREKKFKRNEAITSPKRIKQNCLKKPKPTCRFTLGDLFN